MRLDPCFNCTLPDCDDTSPRCLLRVLTKRVDTKRRKKQHSEITDAERIGSNLRYLVWEIERKAQLSEVTA